MNDAEYEAQKARMQGFIEPWINALGLKWWHRVELEYHRDQQWFEDNDHHGAAATATADWEYQRGTLRFNLPRCVELDDSDAEYVAVHECMHLLLLQMRQAVPDAAWDAGRWMPWEEHTCTDLAKAFMWVRDFASEGKLGEVGCVAREVPA